MYPPCARLAVDFVARAALPSLMMREKHRHVWQPPFTMSSNTLAAVLASSSAPPSLPPGLITCYAVWTRPGVWGGFGACMSSSFWWNNQDFNTTILEKHVGGCGA